MNPIPTSGDAVVDAVCEKLAANANADAIVERIIPKLVGRSQAGQIKYGTTLCAAKLSTEALLNHAQEEALDLANYLQALIIRHDAVTSLHFIQDDVLSIATSLESMLQQLNTEH